MHLPKKYGPTAHSTPECRCRERMGLACVQRGLKKLEGGLTGKIWFDSQKKSIKSVTIGDNRPLVAREPKGRSALRVTNMVSIRREQRGSGVGSDLKGGTVGLHGKSMLLGLWLVLLLLQTGLNFGTPHSSRGRTCDPETCRPGAIKKICTGAIKIYKLVVCASTAIFKNKVGRASR